jgi:hypothetical protein
MLKWLKALFRPPTPSGPPQHLRSFTGADTPITRDGVTADASGWRIDSSGPRVIRLFEVADPGVEKCLLAYRLRMKTENLQNGAYLELWCRFPGRGEFFSKGFQHRVAGTNEWASYEVPFFLRHGQRPDLLRLNLAVEGAGAIWVKDVEVMQTPLA